MAVLVPPSPRTVDTGGQDDHRRYRLRMTQIGATLLTLLVTAWLCTLGAFMAVIAIVVAKHVLVAILVMGLGVAAPRAEPDCSSKTMY